MILYVIKQNTKQDSSAVGSVEKLANSTSTPAITEVIVVFITL
jgi:hypothetical protein